MCLFAISVIAKSGISSLNTEEMFKAEMLRLRVSRLRPSFSATPTPMLSEQCKQLDDTTDADAARLADSLAELAAGRKAAEANVKERTVALKAELAAIVAAGRAGVRSRRSTRQSFSCSTLLYSRICFLIDSSAFPLLLDTATIFSLPGRTDANRHEYTVAVPMISHP